MAEYKAVIVDDSESIRTVITEYLRRIDVEAESYATAEESLAHLFPCAIAELENMPDLMVIDLQLDLSPMQGLDLIREVVSPRRNVPSSIMAISGVIPSVEVFDEIIPLGTAVLLPKPFGVSEFCPRAKRLAEIGKKRRLKQIELLENRISLKDKTREYRPVFISYANEEKSIANGIRIHIESYCIDVWYAPTTLVVGDEFHREIIAGIQNANVFIPIITDSYITSKMCIDELERFKNRMKNDSKNELFLLPIVGNLSTRGRESEVFKSISERYQFIEFYPRLADALTSLTMPIQTHVAKCKHPQRRLGETG